jgi:hypothetical protein
VIGLDQLQPVDDVDTPDVADVVVRDVRDAGPPRDVSGGEVDAPLGDGAIAAGNFACTMLNPQPVVCDDFDEGSIASRWTMVTSMGSVALDTMQASSGPASIAATIGQLDTGQIGQAMLSTSVPLGGASFVDFAADVRLDSFGTNGALTCGIGAPQGMPTIVWTPRFTPQGDGLRVTADTHTDYAASQMLTIDQWTRVRLTIHFTAGQTPSAVTQLFFGPAMVLSVTLPNVTLPDSIDVYVGFQQIIGPTVGNSLVNVDNVTVDVR